MACEATEEFEFYEKNLKYIERLVHDVLAYTLPKFGLPETSLPTTNYEDNIYKFPNFVESAGLRTLAVSLSKRDPWKRMFISRHKNLGFKDDVKLFMKQLILCHKNVGKVTKDFVMELLLSLANELILFFHHERIDIDFNKLIKSASEIIVSTMEPNQDALKATEELYVEFDDKSEYIRWITDFITECAIPYGSRDDVSVLFDEDFGKLWEVTHEETSCSTTQIRDIKTYQKFTVVGLEEALEDPEKASRIVAVGYVLPCDCESPHSKSAENGAPGGRESCKTESTTSSNASDQSKENSENSSELEIEVDLGHKQLDDKGTRQEGGTPKQKLPEKEKPDRKRS